MDNGALERLKTRREIFARTRDADNCGGQDELCDGDQGVDREEDQIAHVPNATTSALPRKHAQ